MTPRGTSSASQMRQHVTACDTRTHFRQPAKPLTFPKTGNAHNGASRRVDVVIDPYGALRGAYFAVGAAIGRPRNDPPNMERADANSYPFGLRICIGVLFIIVFTADGQWPPLHAGMCPALLVCSYRCTDVQNFFRNSYTFFLRLSTILRSSDISCPIPNNTRKRRFSEPRVIQKGQDPFGRFK